MIDSLLETCRLKSLDRAGWRRVGLTRVESVAAHSWGVGWLVLALCPSELDAGLALRYAVLHDVAEVRVGDITPHDGVPKAEKAAREHAAAQGITAPLPNAAALRQDLADYEAQATPEARFVKQLDRLDMALQAVVYAEQAQKTAEGVDAADLGEFLASASKRIDHPVLVPLMTALHRRFTTLVVSPAAS